MVSQKSLEDVTNLIHIAKLDPEDLLPTSHLLHFQSELLDTENYKLVQVPHELIESVLSQKDSLVIRGDPSDSAVLCTRNSTFELKEAETSNTLLITPEVQPPLEAKERSLENVPVYGSFNTYLELTQIKPRLKKLEKLLCKGPYNDRNKKEALGYSSKELLDTIQASERELIDGLRALEAVEIEGKWYSLDEDYLMELITLIYNFIEERSWENSSLLVGDTLDVLSENEPREILRQVIDIYAPPSGEEEEEKESNEMRRMDEEKICRFYGKYILANGTNFDMDEFLKIWQDSVPEGFQTSIDQLKGLALVNNSTIRSFPESSLPHEIAPRLEVLFRIKEKWSLEEIQPYVYQLCTLKMNVNALLTKYTRTSSQRGVKYVSSKHGK